MTKKNSSEYWEDRIASSTWKTYNSLEEKNRELLDFYTDASKAVKEELYTLAEKYSKDGALTLSEMHKQNRLTELNKKYEKIALELGKQTEKTASKNMQDGFREVYKNTAVGMGDIDFSMPNKKLMEKLLNEPWRGDSFSGRLWKNQKKLAVGLNSLLLTGLQQGKTVTEIAVGLHNIMGNAFNDCHRLVRTETMHYLNSATLQRYKDSGVEYVQIWAAQDERTCETCRKYHGKVYPIDKCPILPFHANCRCTVIPCFDEELIKKYSDSHAESGIIKTKEIINKKQAIKRLNDQGIKFTDSRKYPMDEGLMIDCVNWMDSFANRYDKFAQKNPVKLPEIKCMAPSGMKGSVGYYSYYKGTDRAVELALNGQYHSDIKAFDDYVKHCINTEWYPANATTHKTFVHEYGHHVSHSLSQLTNNPNFEHELIDECIKEFKDKDFGSYLDAGDYVSRYAASSESELFAESFAEYFGGENPRAFAKLFGEKIEMILKGV